jgi:hypothetical protein
MVRRGVGESPLLPTRRCGIPSAGLPNTARNSNINAVVPAAKSPLVEQSGARTGARRSNLPQDDRDADDKSADGEGRPILAPVRP